MPSTRNSGSTRGIHAKMHLLVTKSSQLIRRLVSNAVCMLHLQRVSLAAGKQRLIVVVYACLRNNVGKSVFFSLLSF